MKVYKLNQWIKKAGTYDHQCSGFLIVKPGFFTSEDMHSVCSLYCNRLATIYFFLHIIAQDAKLFM